MSELLPVPMDSLVRRMLRELKQCDSVFDLPLTKCFFGSPDHDFSVQFHNQRAATPLGPAAGPHSQMAQNIALAWLGGSRIIELKTVQVLDQLHIPRPCIDMRTVGYNVEWSQELRLEQSAEEYVKGAMLIEMLKTELGDRLTPGFGDTIFDMSVGYDLNGIRSDTVQRFITTMMDASELVTSLRNTIPSEFSYLKSINFPTRLSDTLTLSTFHGCPSNEIEQILEYLMREYRLNVIVKLNPTLLGHETINHLLHDVLGYESIRVPASAFENDTTWQQACGFIERLDKLAKECGVGFGIKLTNTLIVEHDGDFLPSSANEKYLSGQPLHVLAMVLVNKFRQRFGPTLPISFSAGIDRHNFSDAVALGLTPITVCTDLLRQGGFARQRTYFANLMRRMDTVGAHDIPSFILAEHNNSSTTTSDYNQAVLNNTEHYTAQIMADPRYTYERNRKPPPKIGTSLELFDCITCDKCIPVCPNDANFTLPIPQITIPKLICTFDNGQWCCENHGSIELTKKHQIANVADLCNECGNCDIFCPEDGGPYIIKPRFFSSDQSFDRYDEHDGFLVQVINQAVHVRARFNSQQYTLHISGTSAIYKGKGFAVMFSLDDPTGTITSRERHTAIEVDLTYALIMNVIQKWVLDQRTVNFVNSAQ